MWKCSVLQPAFSTIVYTSSGDSILLHSKSVHEYKDVSFWCLAAICVTLSDFMEIQPYLK